MLISDVLDAILLTLPAAVALVTVVWGVDRALSRQAKCHHATCVLPHSETSASQAPMEKNKGDNSNDERSYPEKRKKSDFWRRLWRLARIVLLHRRSMLLLGGMVLNALVGCAVGYVVLGIRSKLPSMVVNGDVDGVLSALKTIVAVTLLANTPLAFLHFQSQRHLRSLWWQLLVSHIQMRYLRHRVFYRLQFPQLGSSDHGGQATVAAAQGSDRPGLRRRGAREPATRGEAAAHAEVIPSQPNESPRAAIDHPDQRIVHDVDDLLDNVQPLISPGLGRFISMFFKSYLLGSSIAGAQGLLMVYAAVIILGSLSVWLARRTEAAALASRKAEAELVSSVGRMVAHAEPIAFMRGGAHEAEVLRRRQTVLLASKFAVLRRRLGVWAISAMTNAHWARQQVGDGLLTFLVIGWALWGSGARSGTVAECAIDRSAEVLQVSSLVAELFFCMFGLLSFTVDIVGRSASISRLAELLEAMEAVSSEGELPVDEASVDVDVDGAGASVGMSGATVRVPGGPVVVRNLSFTVAAGKALLLTGPSGCGKSSIVRALSGLWPVDGGSVRRPRGVGKGGAMFLHQVPYMCIGSLREQITYPSIGTAAAELSNERLQGILEWSCLGYLGARVGDEWDDERDWEAELSVGEQQRIAFARIAFHEPAMVVFDESTSALDEEMEAILYSRCRDRGITLVSVGHRPSLRQFHDVELALQPNSEWEVHEIDPSSAGVFTTDGDSAPPSAALPGAGRQANARDATSSSESFDASSSPVWPSLGSVNLVARIAVTSSHRSRSVLLVAVWLALLLLHCVLEAVSAGALGTAVQTVIESDLATFVDRVLLLAVLVGAHATVIAAVQFVGGLCEAQLTDNLMDGIRTGLCNEGVLYPAIRDVHLPLPDHPEARMTRDSKEVVVQTLSMVQVVVQSVVLLLLALRSMSHISAPTFLSWPLLMLALNFVVVRALHPRVSAALDKRQAAVAEFQRVHARLRKHAEAIAFYGGEAFEARLLDRCLKRCVSTASHAAFLSGTQASLSGTFRALGSAVAGVVPALASLERGIDPSLGVSAQVGRLRHMELNSSRAIQLVDTVGGRLSSLAPLVGHLDRVVGLLNSASWLREHAGSVRAVDATDVILQVDDVTVSPPARITTAKRVDINDTVVARRLSFSLPQRGRLLVEGESGCGKSCVMRVLAGLAQPRQGKVHAPQALSFSGNGGAAKRASSMLALPQVSYLPEGTLADIVGYPMPHSMVCQLPREDLARALARAGVAYLADRPGGWKRVCNWSTELSIGEQQRVSFARIFLHGPDLVLLDEATSALDEAMEQRLYTTLRELDIAYISVGHHPLLREFHEQRLSLRGPRPSQSAKDSAAAEAASWQLGYN